MPNHGETAICKNCDHLIYYQFDKWEHFTRHYKPHGFAYTTTRCFAPGSQPYSWYIDGVQQTCCGCENPEAQSLVTTAKVVEE